MADAEQPAQAGWRIPAHGGRDYVGVLTRLHDALRPRRYLEIGTLRGATLGLAKCPAIAIDPNMAMLETGKLNRPVTLLFQMTSDAFFAEHSPSALLGGPIELAFLDGMHWFEFLLRDFMHVERHCRRNAVVLLHDCLPGDEHVARRVESDRSLAGQSRQPHAWAGDVWKAALIIRRLRPDLAIHAFDSPPTGLVAITGLDPESDVLRRAYFDAVREYRDLTLGEVGPQALLSELGYRPFPNAMPDLANLFWL